MKNINRSQSHPLEREIKNKLKLLSNIFENSTEAIIINNRDGIIKWANKAVTKITGYKKEELIGNRLEFFNINKKDFDYYKPMHQAILEKGSWEGELCLKRKDGECYIGFFSIFSIDNNKEDSTHFVSIFRDVTENKKKEKKINHLAFRDHLTGLHNRRFFMDRLKSEIDKAQIAKKKLALLFIDLVEFKKINDHLGHLVGDQLLKVFGRQLKKCIEKGNIVGRLGGDEFVILMPKINNITDGIGVAQRIIETLKKPFIIDEHELYIHVSIGIALYPDDGLDFNTLMKNADIAMYKAKEAKENKIEIFTSILREEIKEQFILENNLRQALNKKEFFLKYQPIIDLNTKEIVGVEALLRWKNKELGLVPPEKFIPAAEKTNLILSIGKWVLQRACEQNKKWQNLGYKPISIFANISVKQLEHKDFIKMVDSILKETGLDPKYLQFEITESISAENSKYIHGILKKLKNLGIQLAIDDFGTGYSSLGQLKNLPISTLKIDKTFIHDMNDTAIISAIIAMGKNLKLNVLAEGIETHYQLKFLEKSQCNMGQGYLFSYPIIADEFEKLFKKS